MSLQSTKDRTDNWINTNYTRFKSTQDRYTGRRFFQGLSTHSTPPRHTGSVNDDRQPDRMQNKPTDRSDSWQDFFPEIASQNLPSQMQCHEYDGPNGKGWVLIFEFRFENETWIKFVGSGAENRSQDWFLFIEER